MADSLKTPPAKSPGQLERSAQELTAHRSTLAFARDRLEERRGLGLPQPFLLALNRSDVSALVTALDDAVAALEHLADLRRILRPARRS